MKTRTTLLCASVLAGLSACADDMQPQPSDAGSSDGGLVIEDAGSVDAGTVADARTIIDDAGIVFEPISGGGTAGGELRGQLTVFVYDGTAKTPIADATVLLALNDETLTLTTNASGVVEIRDRRLIEPVDLHCFADGYTYHSVVRLDAKTVTVNLFERTPSPPAESVFATITGTVTGFELLPTATGSTAQYARIYSSSGLVESMPRSLPAPLELQSDEVVRGPSYPEVVDYEVRVNTQSFEGILVAFGGLGELNSGTYLPRDASSFSHIGFIDTGTVATEEVNAGRDIALTHALDVVVDVTIKNPAAALHAQPRRVQSFVLPGLELKSSGRQISFPFGVGGMSSSDLDHMQQLALPDLTGAFSDAQYSLPAIASTDGPFRITAKWVRGAQTSWIVDGLLEVPEDATFSERTVSASLPPDIDLMTVMLFARKKDEPPVARPPAWIIEVHRAAQSVVEFPQVPAGLTDPLGPDFELGDLNVRTDQIDGVDFGNFRKADLLKQITASSQNEVDF